MNDYWNSLYTKEKSIIIKNFLLDINTEHVSQAIHPYDLKYIIRNFSLENNLKLNEPLVKNNMADSSQFTFYQDIETPSGEKIYEIHAISEIEDIIKGDIDQKFRVHVYKVQPELELLAVCVKDIHPNNPYNIFIGLDPRDPLVEFFTDIEGPDNLKGNSSVNPNEIFGRFIYDFLIRN